MTGMTVGGLVARLGLAGAGLFGMSLIAVGGAGASAEGGTVGAGFGGMVRPDAIHGPGLPSGAGPANGAGAAIGAVQVALADVAASDRGAVSGAGAAGGPVAPGEDRWQWPLDPRPRVLRRFVAPVSTYGPGHRGLDLAAPPGAPVLAVEGGLVTHAGSVAGRGTVTVEHEDGLRSTYEPVTPGVARGAQVEAGDALGVVQPVGAAAPHCATATCLHLGARLGPAYLDPLPLLTGGRLALLPLTMGR